MKSCVCPVGSTATACASQTLLYSVPFAMRDLLVDPFKANQWGEHSVVATICKRYVIYIIHRDRLWNFINFATSSQLPSTELLLPRRKRAMSRSRRFPRRLQ